jgi:enediyne biosynthesis protein E3
MRPSHFRRIVTGIRPKEEVFLRSGFRIGDLKMRRHLERVGRAVLHGFQEAVTQTAPHDLRRLDDVPKELGGFAHMGAAIGLGCFDVFLPQLPSRIQQLSAGTSSSSLVQLGAGWASARVTGMRSALIDFGAVAPPFMASLGWVGYGAAHAYFHWDRCVGQRRSLPWLTSDERSAFDEGVGCVLWLGEGAGAEHVAMRIADFENDRHGDLWAGVGFGSTYVGVAARSALRYLVEASGPYRTYLAEGAAKAGRFRNEEDSVDSYTDTTCQELCGRPAVDCARLTRAAERGLPLEARISTYQAWRKKIRSSF